MNTLSHNSITGKDLPSQRNLCAIRVMAKKDRVNVGVSIEANEFLDWLCEKYSMSKADFVEKTIMGMHATTDLQRRAILGQLPEEFEVEVLEAALKRAREERDKGKKGKAG
jgi:hypothetical protein